MSTMMRRGNRLVYLRNPDAQDGLPVSMPGIEGGDSRDHRGGQAGRRRYAGVARRKIRPQRANLAVHHKLLHELVQRQAVIPCAFGMVATSEEQLQKVLRANRDELLRELAMFRGKVEMSLGVYWNTSNIFEFFVASNQELKRMRDRLFRPGREPSMEERLELGKLFESLLRQCRERHTQQVIDTLSPYSARDSRRRSRSGTDDYEVGVPGPQGPATAFRGGHPRGGPQVRRPLLLQVQRAVGAI